MRIQKSFLPLLLFSVVASATAQTEVPASPQIPVRVALPVQKPFPVTLDTPLSTLDSRQGQTVTFHLTYSLLLGDGLEVPPDTKILGHVEEVRRSGHFDKQGVLRLAVDRIQLNANSGADAGANLQAHLDFVSTKGRVHPETEMPASNDTRGMAADSAGGAVIGGATGGAAGAGIGAGAGVAAAVLILMSRRGQELYLVTGTRFTVTIDQPAYLSGDTVHTAQQNFKQNPGPYGIESDSENDGTPKLKRRRAPQQ